jgi:hypothetical protein
MSDGQDWAERAAAKIFGIRRLADNGTVLEREYDTANLVPPLRAAENTPDDRFEISIDPVALIPDVPTNDTVWVDPVEGDDLTAEANQQTKPFATLAAANAAATALVPSATNPVLISLRPGIHTTPPLTMQTFVTFAGVDGCETAIIQASTATSPLITGADGAVVKNVTIQGANGAGGIGVLMAVAGSMRVESVCIRDCTIGARCSGAGSELLVLLGLFTRVSGEVMDRGVDAVSSGHLTANLCTMHGAPGSLIGLAAAADGGALDVGGQFIISYAISALYAENGGVIQAQGGIIGFCTNGIHIAPTNGIIRAATVGTTASTAEDVLVEGAASLLIVADLGHEKQLSIAAGSLLFGTRVDATQLTIFNEASFSVGAAGRPATASFGSGGIHVDGLRAYHSTDTEIGVFTDVTDEVASASGSVIDLVPGTGVANSFFIGADEPLPGLFFDVTLAQSGGTIVPKYWNGAAWVAIPRWMTTENAAPYTPTGNALMAAAGAQNMRFGGITSDTAKALGATGVVKHWYLFEVTSILTTIPQIESAALHSHHTRIDPDGKIEHFGDARPVVYADLDLNIWEGGGSSGNDGTTSYSPNVTRGRLGADFPNAQTRDMGYLWPLPPGYDTSYEAELIVQWKPSTTNTGTMTLTKHHVIVPPDSLLNGTLSGEVSLAANETPNGVADREQSITYPIVAPTAIAGVDSLAMTLIRAGASDAFSGAAEVEKVTLRYRAWR